jgi:hypothetical protein
VIKLQFGHIKVRDRGLKKNTEEHGAVAPADCTGQRGDGSLPNETGRVIRPAMKDRMSFAPRVRAVDGVIGSGSAR